MMAPITPGVRGWGTRMRSPAKDRRPPEGNMPSTPAYNRLQNSVSWSIVCWAPGPDFSSSPGSRHYLCEAGGCLKQILHPLLFQSSPSLAKPLGQV